VIFFLLGGRKNKKNDWFYEAREEERRGLRILRTSEGSRRDLNQFSAEKVWKADQKEIAELAKSINLPAGSLQKLTPPQGGGRKSEPTYWWAVVNQKMR